MRQSVAGLLGCQPMRAPDAIDGLRAFRSDGFGFYGADLSIVDWQYRQSALAFALSSGRAS